MKKPDRFDRLSESVCEEYRTGQCLIRDILKKKFKAQHAAYVRMVRHIGDTVEAGESGTSAINTVLAALERYRKGKS